MLKIIHCADIHAGRPALSGLPSEKASVRRREIETSLNRIVDLVRQESADLLLIAGDLFEHLYARPSWAKDASALLRSIPGTQVFISPGNHDPIVRGSLYRGIDWPGNVTVFSSPHLTAVDVAGSPVTVHGFGWTSFQERQRALLGYAAQRKDRINVLLIHGDLSRGAVAASSQYLPISPSDLESSGMDYAALGHIHIPGEFMAKDTVAAYPGCPEPLDFGDEGERGVFMVRIGEKAGPAAKVETEFIPIATRRVRKVELDITGFETAEQVRGAVATVGDEDSRRRDLWAVSLTGVVDPELHLELPVIEREAGEGFFFVRLIADYKPAYDLESLGDSRRGTLEARFVREMLSQIEGAGKAGDVGAAQIAQDALFYGLDALRQGRILLRKGGSD